MKREKKILIGLLIFMSFGVRAAENLSGAQAMYIYNFLRHVKWPENSTGNVFVIGVYGNSATYEQLVAFTKDRLVGTKTIEIKKIATIEEAKKCQLLFVPSSKTSQIGTIKNAIGNSPCLIVSENEGSNANGSSIEFVIIDNKLKFKIDEGNAKKQQLIISRALLDMSA